MNLFQYHNHHLSKEHLDEWKRRLFTWQPCIMPTTLPSSSWLVTVILPGTFGGPDQGLSIRNSMQ